MINHLALIIDGNRRWGKKNSINLYQSYKAGGEKLNEIISYLIELKIKYLTIYAFSLENFQRSVYEIALLNKIFKTWLNDNLNYFLSQKIKLKFIGNLSNLPYEISNVLYELENLTAQNDKFYLQIAVSYSGRNEIVRCFKKINNDVMINESIIDKYLDTCNTSDPEILIRTGGQKRLSNFLLWQIANTEIFFIEKLWPEFEKEDLLKILDEYNKIIKNNGI